MIRVECNILRKGAAECLRRAVEDFENKYGKPPFGFVVGRGQFYHMQLIEDDNGQFIVDRAYHLLKTPVVFGLQVHVLENINGVFLASDVGEIRELVWKQYLSNL